MLDQLYPISFVVSLLGLILWFYFQKNKKLSRLMSATFLIGFLTYLVSLSFSSGELSYKLMILFRDLVIITIVSQFFNFFKANAIAFVIMLVILLGVIKMSFFQVLEQTFPQQSLSAQFDDQWELLIEINDGYAISDLNQMQEQYGLEIERAFFPQNENDTDLDQYYVVGIPDRNESKLKKIVRAIQKIKAVEWVEDNETIQLDEIESEAMTSKKSKFFLNDPGLQEQWGFEPLNANQLHEFLSHTKVKPKKKALVAILDTGIDSKHEDIAAQYRSVQSKSDNDPRGHGTHCAGIAGAVSNNKKGIASFAPNQNYIEVTSVKVLSSMGGGTQKSIIDGMIFAADQGADVLSLSLGGRSSHIKQKAYNEAVRYAQQKGAIVVVAAGNNSADAKDISPANADGVITVSATNPENGKAFFSNHVKNIKYAVAAPGQAIYSTIPNNKYATFNGTSMACPHVSGLIGIMKSFYPDLTTEEAYQIINRTGKETKDGQETGRLIQPYEALLELMD